MKGDVQRMGGRYVIIIFFVVLIALLIVIRAVGFMTFQRKAWMTVAGRFEADSVLVQPTRGSILADGGEVLVSSTPEYRLVFKYRDYTKGRDEQLRRDEAVRRNMSLYTKGLHELIPEESEDEFRRLIEEALTKGSKSIKEGKRTGLYTSLYTKGTKRLTYNRYKEVREFLDSCNLEYTLMLDISGMKRADRSRLEQTWRDSLDVVTEGLHRIVPSMSAVSFRDSITHAIAHPYPAMKLCSLKLNYRQMAEVKTLPMMHLDNKHKTGFYVTQKADPRGFTFDEVMVRKNAYGLATRTVGMWDEEQGTPRNGLELAFDSLLSGTPGLSHRRKVMNTYAEFIDVPPRNGQDIVTTIDVRIQDIADKALRDQLEEQNADYGTAIVMEAKTGYLRAVVNLTRQDGQFVVGQNYALNQGIETGSIFKTASILCALDDKEVTLTDSVYTAPFTRTFYGYSMSDDAGKARAWKTIPEVLKYSSNIGTMTVIDDHYVKKGKADAYLKKLLGMGIAADHHVIPGATRSKLKTYEQLKNWKGEALWMAVGYGISVTPVNMVAFYNAIANGGRMMRPQLVQRLENDGKVIERFEPETVVEAIASPEAIHDITRCLIGVVNDEGGTGTRAHSDRFVVAGKTGTAKVTEKSGYAGRWLNFCGFFPADAPEYTCGVFVWRGAGHTGAANGGGSMSAPVLREIAERTMAYSKTSHVAEMADSTATLIPQVKTGNIAAADEVLDRLHIRGDSLRGTPLETEEGRMPSVVGMGARDALFTLETLGLHPRLHGAGAVSRQSIAAGAGIKRGQVVELYLKRE